MLDHGLLVGQPPPSRGVLLAWLEARGVVVCDGVEIASMADGSGWRVVATRDLDIAEAICKIPKDAILSVRTSSLPRVPAFERAGSNSATILGLALALLHELRLGPASAFWGYTQSLPRETVPVPPLWPLAGEGSDAASALPWLGGTEAERELERRKWEGVDLASMRAFYAKYADYLPATPLHALPSPFAAFAHAFSLVSTRAFLVDLYHLVALCPFADVLNHSSSAHTSLASDDFVCHLCGSLPVCGHDEPDEEGEVERLAHLSSRERTRIAHQPDTVDMYLERGVRASEEVYNSYGDGLSPGRVLVEWGFVPSREDVPRPDSDAEFGDVLTFPPDAMGLTVKEVDVVAAADEAAAALWPDTDPGPDALFARPHAGRYHVNAAGQACLRLFAAVYARHADLGTFTADVAALEARHAVTRLNFPPHLVPISPSAHRAAADFVAWIAALLRGMYRPDLSTDDLEAMRNALPPHAALQRMAMTLALDERLFLRSLKARWDALIEPKPGHKNNVLGLDYDSDE